MPRRMPGMGAHASGGQRWLLPLCLCTALRFCRGPSCTAWSTAARSFHGIGARGRRPPLSGCRGCSAHDHRSAAAAAAFGVSRSNPYDVLGVPAQTEEGGLRDAFRALVKVYHPDVPGTGDDSRFRLLIWAIEELSTQEGRRRWSTSVASSSRSAVGSGQTAPEAAVGWASAGPLHPGVWGGLISDYERLAAKNAAQPVHVRHVKKRKKRNFDASGRLWDSRRKRTSGRLAASADNSAEGKALAASDRISKDKKRHKQKSRRQRREEREGF